MIRKIAKIGSENDAKAGVEKICAKSPQKSAQDASRRPLGGPPEAQIDSQGYFFSGPGGLRVVSGRRLELHFFFEFFAHLFSTPSLASLSELI